MNASRRIVDFSSSDEANFTCSDCGRSVKYLAHLNDGRSLGLDCAATALGRSRSRSSLRDIELEARAAAASAKGASWVAAHPRPAGMSRREWLAPMAVAAPYPVNSREWHAFVGAA